MNHYKGVTTCESGTASLRQVVYETRGITESLCAGSVKCYSDITTRSQKLRVEINVRVLCTQLKVSMRLNFGAVSNTRTVKLNSMSESWTIGWLSKRTQLFNKSAQVFIVRVIHVLISNSNINQHLANLVCKTIVY